MDHPFCTYDLKIDICLSFKNNSIPIRFWMHSCLLKSLKYFLNYFELFLGKDHRLSRNQMCTFRVLLLCFNARASASIPRGPAFVPPCSLLTTLWGHECTGKPSVGPLRTLASCSPREAKDGRQSSIRLSAEAVSREVPVGCTGNRLFAGCGLAGTGR